MHIPTKWNFRCGSLKAVFRCVYFTVLLAAACTNSLYAFHTWHVREHNGLECEQWMRSVKSNGSFPSSFVCSCYACMHVFLCFLCTSHFCVSVVCCPVTHLSWFQPILIVHFQSIFALLARSFSDSWLLEAKIFAVADESKRVLLVHFSSLPMGALKNLHPFGVFLFHKNIDNIACGGLVAFEISCLVPSDHK